MEKELTLAVLIDAENISPKYMEAIISEANSCGNVIYKRIYGNWTSQQMASWKPVILDNAIQPIQQYSNTTGKNSTDSALIIDAMDLLYQSNLDGFCIVSSDSDFTRLASRLRESGKYIIGMGESKTPRSFISACSKFVYLDLILKETSDNSTVSTENVGAALGASEGGKSKSGSTAAKGKAAASTSRTRKPAAKSVKPITPAATIPAAETVGLAEPIESPVKISYFMTDEEVVHTPAPASGKDLAAIKLSLLRLVEENSDDDGWIFSGKLGSLLTRQFSDFDVRNFGFKKFVPFIKSLDLFEVSTSVDENNASIKHNYFKIKE